MMDRKQPQPDSFDELVRRAQAERAAATGELIGRGVKAVSRGVSALGHALLEMYRGERRRTQREAQAAIESWAGRY
jgi:hypothetical protein